MFVFIFNCRIGLYKFWSDLFLFCENKNENLPSISLYLIGVYFWLSGYPVILHSINKLKGSPRPHIGDPDFPDRYVPRLRLPGLGR
ncbi:hypothetical protein Avbf_15259 [Armadillidium vulgare]|nr:hypothetical protein Avbf_15259 [Armadillidium vulgare]